MTKRNISVLVHVALLIALEILLGRIFSFLPTQFMRFSLGFLPIAVCAMLYGPVWAGVAGALSDILGVTLFPTQGVFFPGFTVSALLTGVLFGIFFWQKNGELKHIRLILGIAINAVLVSLFLQAFWMTVAYGKAFDVFAVQRLIQVCIMSPVQFMILRLLCRPVLLYSKRLPSP